MDGNEEGGHAPAIAEIDGNRSQFQRHTGASFEGNDAGKEPHCGSDGDRGRGREEHVVHVGSIMFKEWGEHYCGAIDMIERGFEGQM